MYEAFFGLKRAPFKVAPDPAFLYWSRNHKVGDNVLEAGVELLSPITVISGDVGTGKTTLLRQFLENASDDLKVGLISSVTSGFGDIHSSIAHAFDLGDHGTSVNPFRAFERFLLAEYTAGRRCVLIIDEAEKLSDEDLETLRLLTVLNTGNAASLMLVLVGQKELRARLSKPNNRQIAQRVGVAFELGPMSEEDTRSYVRHRLSTAGATREIFDDEALKQIHEFTDGVPRLINLVCDQALVTAFGDDVEAIDGKFIEAYLREAIDTGMLAHFPTPRGSGEPAREQSEPVWNYGSLSKLEPILRSGGRVADTAATPDTLPFEPIQSRLQRSPQPTPSAKHSSVQDDELPEAFRSTRDQEHAANSKGVDEKPELPKQRLTGADTYPGDKPQRRDSPETELARNENNPAITIPAPVSEFAPASQSSLPVVAKNVLMDSQQPIPRRRFTGPLVKATVGGLALLATVLLVKTIPPQSGQEAELQDTSVLPPVHKELNDTGQSESLATLRVASPEPEVTPLDNPVGAELMEQALEMGVSDPGAAALAYARAALRGEDRAAYYLGQLYETGDGVSRSLGLARAWYKHVSETVRSARRRVEALEITDVEGPLAPPIPVMGGPVVDGGSEFVWTVGAGADAAFYVVEVASDQFSEVTRYAPQTRSAMLAETIEEARIWRVISTDPETAQYVVSDWASMGSDASPSSLGKSPVVPSALVVTPPENTTPRLEHITASLTADGLSFETVERMQQGEQETAVRYVYDADQEHAERVAAILGSGVPTVQGDAEEPDVLPGQLTITLAP